MVKGEGQRAFVQQVSWFRYPVDRRVDGVMCGGDEGSGEGILCIGFVNFSF